MTTMIAIPDELVEQVKLVTPTAVDAFFINAGRRELRQIRARQLRDEYERTQVHRTPREVYEGTLASVIAFESRYNIGSDQFLRDFEAGVIDEDPSDWVAFYRWRILAYALRHLEKEYGFKRATKGDAHRQT